MCLNRLLIKTHFTWKRELDMNKKALGFRYRSPKEPLDEAGTTVLKDTVCRDVVDGEHCGRLRRS